MGNDSTNKSVVVNNNEQYRHPQQGWTEVGGSGGSNLSVYW